MPFSMGSPLGWGLSCSFFEPFLAGPAALLFDDGALVGTGLSFELELCEFERAFSPFVDEDVSLPDLRLRPSLGMASECEGSWNAEGERIYEGCWSITSGGQLWYVDTSEMCSIRKEA